jgi:hypothetical protein
MNKIFQFRKATLKDPKNTEVMSFDKSMQPVGDKKGEPSLADQIKRTRRAEIEQRKIKNINRFKAEKK